MQESWIRDQGLPNTGSVFHPTSEPKSPHHTHLQSLWKSGWPERWTPIRPTRLMRRSLGCRTDERLAEALFARPRQSEKWTQRTILPSTDSQSKKRSVTAEKVYVSGAANRDISLVHVLTSQRTSRRRALIEPSKGRCARSTSKMSHPHLIMKTLRSISNNFRRVFEWARRADVGLA